MMRNYAWSEETIDLFKTRAGIMKRDKTSLFSALQDKQAKEKVTPCGGLRLLLLNHCPCLFLFTAVDSLIGALN